MPWHVPYSVQLQRYQKYCAQLGWIYMRHDVFGMHDCLKCAHIACCRLQVGFTYTALGASLISAKPVSELSPGKRQLIHYIFARFTPSHISNSTVCWVHLGAVTAKVAGVMKLHDDLRT